MVFLTPWLLLATPRSTAGMWLMAATALLSTATEPQCAIFLPVALWRIVQSRRTRPVIAARPVGVTAQVATSLVAPRALGSQVPPLASTIEGYVLNAGMSLGTQHTTVLGWALVHVGVPVVSSTKSTIGCRVRAWCCPVWWVVWILRSVLSPRWTVLIRGPGGDARCVHGRGVGPASTVP